MKFKVGFFAGVIILVVCLLLPSSVIADEAELNNGPYENKSLYIWHGPEHLEFFMNCNENDPTNNRESDSGTTLTSGGQVSLIAEQEPFDDSKNLYLDTTRNVVAWIYADLTGAIESITATLYHSMRDDDHILGTTTPATDSELGVYKFRFNPGQEMVSNHLFFVFRVDVLTGGVQYTFYTDGRSYVNLPLLRDTDSDGQVDRDDVDDDNDGLSDTEETQLGTDITKQDTDADGYNDDIDKYPLDSSKWEDKSDSDSNGDDDGGLPGFEAVILIGAVLILAILFRSCRSDPKR